jgi:hypothetical protein
MGIEDIQISEELETNAPSIKYRGNEGPKSPQEMEQMMIASLEEEYAKYKFEMLEQGLEPVSLQKFIEQAMAEAQMSGGQPLPQDPTKPVNPFAPKPTGPVLPDRQMAAYGGIMGLDGRKQYGIGSWFQKKIMDPIKKNPVVSSLVGGALVNQFGIPFTGTAGDRAGQNWIGKLLGGRDAVLGEGGDGKKLFNIGEFLETKKNKNDEKSQTYGEVIRDSIGKNILPAAGGIMAGLFTDGQGGGKDASTYGVPNDDTAMNIQNLTKTANLLDQKQGLAAGMNFLPAVSARKFSPEEMAIAYSQEAANGGRIGFDNGGGVINPFNEFETFKLKNLGYDVAGKGTEPFGGESVLRDILRVNRANGGIMDLGGMEKDYRAEGGFVPIGKQEKADDVPARLSVNEFVFTADAVRNAGGGDIDQGAQVMENMMKHLEQGGQVSEESQGMAGARDMFATSQRLGDVV